MAELLRHQGNIIAVKSKEGKCYMWMHVVVKEKEGGEKNSKEVHMLGVIFSAEMILRKKEQKFLMLQFKDVSKQISKQCYYNV